MTQIAPGSTFSINVSRLSDSLITPTKIRDAAVTAGEQRPGFDELIRQHLKNRPDRPFDVFNADGEDDEPAELRLYDVIGWPWLKARLVADALDEITASEIVVSINSPGGDVFDGVAIYNLLRQHDAHITTRVDSLAASIASIIAQAGDRRIMVTSSEMMIHKAWGIVIGTDEEMAKARELLSRQDDKLANIYARAAGDGRKKAKFLGLMSEETWFSPDEAVDIGLADEVVDPPAKTRSDDDTQNRNTPFSEHASSVIAEVEQLLNRTEEVIAFRTEQGKTPLNDTVREELAAAQQRLTDVLTEVEAPDNTTDTLDEIYYRLVESEHQEELAS